MFMSRVGETWGSWLVSREKMDNYSRGWRDRRCRGRREENKWGWAVQGPRGAAPIPLGPGLLEERKDHYSFSPRRAPSKTVPTTTSKSLSASSLKIMC